MVKPRTSMPQALNVFRHQESPKSILAICGLLWDPLFLETAIEALDSLNAGRGLSAFISALFGCRVEVRDSSRVEGSTLQALGPE